MTRRLPVCVAGLAAVALAGIARAHYEPCVASNGTDSCLRAESCSIKDGATGICLPPPCAGDEDCVLDPLRRCDTRQSPSVCIECYQDTECTAPSTCELDPRSPLTNRCVECGLGRAGACDTSDTGHRCLLDRGLCGCVTNDDCPGGHFCRRGACVLRPTVDAMSSVDDGPDGGGDAGGSTAGGAPPRADSGAGGCSSSPGSVSGVALLAAVVALMRRAREATRRR